MFQALRLYHCDTSTGCPLGMAKKKCYVYVTRSLCSAKHQVMEYNGRLKDFANEICMGTGVKDAYMKVFDVAEVSRHKVMQTLNHPIVGELLTQAKDRAIEECAISKQRHLEDLLQIRNLAIGDKSWSAAITAQFSSASLVDAPRCGSVTTFGWSFRPFFGKSFT